MTIHAKTNHKSAEMEVELSTVPHETSIANLELTALNPQTVLDANVGSATVD